MEYLDKVKGFLDDTEAKKLSSLISKTSSLGHALEIGTYCGKSALVFSEACNKNNSYIFTLDHHIGSEEHQVGDCLLYTSPSPRDLSTSRMPSSA